MNRERNREAQRNWQVQTKRKKLIGTGKDEQREREKEKNDTVKIIAVLKIHFAYFSNSYNIIADCSFTKKKFPAKTKGRNENKTFINKIFLFVCLFIAKTLKNSPQNTKKKF